MAESENVNSPRSPASVAASSVATTVTSASSLSSMITELGPNVTCPFRSSLASPVSRPSVRLDKETATVSSPSTTESSLISRLTVCVLLSPEAGPVTVPGPNSTNWPVVKSKSSGSKALVETSVAEPVPPSVTSARRVTSGATAKSVPARAASCEPVISRLTSTSTVPSPSSKTCPAST